MTKSIAVINAGSSSVKFAIYDAEKDERCQFRGQVEGIERDFATQGFDHGAAMREITATGRALLEGRAVAAFAAPLRQGERSPLRISWPLL